MKQEAGFSLIEIMIAIVLVSVGVLATATSSALVTRMIAAGQRSAVASSYATERLERLRVNTCTVQAAGTDTLFRGGKWAAINTWAFVNAGNGVWRIALTSSYKGYGNVTRTAQLEAQVVCIN